MCALYAIKIATYFAAGRRSKYFFIEFLFINYLLLCFQLVLARKSSIALYLSKLLNMKLLQVSAATTADRQYENNTLKIAAEFEVIKMIGSAICFGRIKILLLKIL